MFFAGLLACILLPVTLDSYSKPSKQIQQEKKSVRNRSALIKKIARYSVKLIPKKMATVTPEFTGSVSMYLGVLITKNGLIMTSEDVVNGLGDEVIAVVQDKSISKYYPAKVVSTGLGYGLLKIDAPDTEFEHVERGGLGIAGDNAYAVYLNRATGVKEVSQAQICSIEPEYLPLTSACVGECVNLSTKDPLHIGCPVFNECGDLVGICTMTQGSRGTIYTNTALTITGELLKQVMEGVAMERKYLAIEANPHNDPSNHHSVVRVRSSHSGQLQRDDLIVGVDGSGFNDLYHLAWIIQKAEKDSVTLRVVRGQEEMDVVEAVQIAPSHKMVNLFQIALQPMILNTGECVLYVAYLQSVSPLIKCLSVGESIVRINGAGFKTADDGARMLNEVVGRLRFKSIPFVLEVVEPNGTVITKRSVQTLSID